MIPNSFRHILPSAAALVLLFQACSSGQNLLLNSSFENGGFNGTNQFVDQNNSMAFTTDTSAHGASENTLNDWGTGSSQWIYDPTRATDGDMLLWLAGGGAFCAGQELSFGVGQILEPSQLYRFSYDWAAVSFNGGNPGDNTALGSPGSTGPRLELSWVDAGGSILSMIHIFEANDFRDAFTSNYTSLLATTNWGSLQLDPGVAGSGWNRSYVEYSFPDAGAPVGATGILVSFSNSGLATNSSGLALDNADISAIPEPSGPLLLGLALIFPMTRRKRNP